MSEEIFQVNDVVEAFGCRGVVNDVAALGDYPVTVYFPDGMEDENFTSDGKIFMWHKLPSLKLIERPKKKKKITLWIGLSSKLQHGTYRTSLAYPDREIIKKLDCENGAYSIEAEVEE